MLIPLKTAYEVLLLEPGACSNSYDWYRQRAQRDGVVRFGSRRQLVRSSESGVIVTKVKGQWMVNQEDLDAELAEHRAARGELEQITSDYRSRILHGKAGATLRTTFGSYTVYVGFHSIWRSDAKPWKESGVYWFCSRCWQPATLAHDKPECHTCSDWGGCGRDCTLSEVSCETCGTAMAM
jgi:hypothetical protein